MVSALIDTGCSLCVIDSTYAVDSCNINVNELNTGAINQNGTKVHTVFLNKIVFCETIFEKVLCVVTDLKGIYKHYAPSFIVGANILKNNSWFFDLKNGLIKQELPQSTNKMSIKWKNHEDYHDVAKDYIVFDGSIKGQKARFIFDTGCKFNKLQHGINLSNMVLIEKETANMDHKLSKETAYLFKNVDFKLGKNKFNVDFLKSEKKCCYLNIEFLNGRNFILNYPQKTLDIID